MINKNAHFNVHENIIMCLLKILNLQWELLLYYNSRISWHHIRFIFKLFKYKDIIVL